MVVAIAASCVLVVSVAVAAEMPGTVQFATSTGRANSRNRRECNSLLPGRRSLLLRPEYNSLRRRGSHRPARSYGYRPSSLGAPPPAARSRPLHRNCLHRRCNEPRPWYGSLTAPRVAVVQPVPLPPPTEGIAPGTPLGQQVSPPNYGDYTLRPIGSLTINIAPKEGQVPREVNPTKTLEKEFGATEFQREPLDYSYMWESPAFFNRPLYFEQPNLERYGYDWGISQFWISGAQVLRQDSPAPVHDGGASAARTRLLVGLLSPGQSRPYQINWPEVRLTPLSSRRPLSRACAS